MSNIARIREDRRFGPSNNWGINAIFDEVAYVKAPSRHHKGQFIFAVINNQNKWDLFVGTSIKDFHVSIGTGRGIKKDGPKIRENLSTDKMKEMMEFFSIPEEEANVDNSHKDFYNVRKNETLSTVPIHRIMNIRDTLSAMSIVTAPSKYEDEKTVFAIIDNDKKWNLFLGTEVNIEGVVTDNRKQAQQIAEGLSYENMMSIVGKISTPEEDVTLETKQASSYYRYETNKQMQPA